MMNGWKSSLVSSSSTSTPIPTSSKSSTSTPTRQQHHQNQKGVKDVNVLSGTSVHRDLHEWTNAKLEDNEGFITTGVLVLLVHYHYQLYANSLDALRFLDLLRVHTLQ
ncbi:hypothetical protein QYF36_005797 [Acer negundo]|nr:hypothetical protein QYF36_005797 [Acer negundo]